MAFKFLNRARMTTTTTGTGTITLGSAVTRFQSFSAAGIADGDTVHYVIEDGTAWEIGLGTYTASGTTLARTTRLSSSTGASLNLSGTAVVSIDAIAEDFTPSGIGAQPVDATLTSIALLGTAADKIAYTTGVDTWAETGLTSTGRS